MGSVRFFRRVQIAPGVRLNLARRGAALSLGVRGAHITFGRRGVRRTYGLPGSGLFYTSRHGWHSGAHTAPQFAPVARSPAAGVAGTVGSGSWWKLVLLALGLVALAALGQTFGR